jgi:hypothetical protein
MPWRYKLHSMQQAQYHFIPSATVRLVLAHLVQRAAEYSSAGLGPGQNSRQQLAACSDVDCSNMITSRWMRPLHVQKPYSAYAASSG